MAKKGLSPQEVKPLLTGVINIQFTPFKSATQIDEAALAENTRFMIEGGIVNGKGVQVIGGSNGEGFSLSESEYRTLIDTVVEAADGRVPVVVGCARPATRPVIELAKYAQQAGADAVMVLAPFYYWNPSPDIVYHHFKAIADETNIGIMIYNNATVTGLDMPIELIERLAEIDRIVALKETTSNMFKLRRVIHHFKDRFSYNTNTYRWMMPLDYLFGNQGFNTIFGNIDPSFAVKMHETGASGDFDKNNALWRKMVDLYTFLFSGDMYRATALGKEMARLAGLPMGKHNRLPLLPVTDAEREHLRKLMTEADLGLRTG